MGIYAEALKRAREEGFIRVDAGRAGVFGAGAAPRANGRTPRPGGTPRRVMPRAFYAEVSRLREHLSYLFAGHQHPVIALCGLDGGEGASSVAYALATLQAGSLPLPAGPFGGRRAKPVFLLDANTYAPAIGAYFGIAAQPGLAEVVEKNTPLIEGTYWFLRDRLAVVPVGGAGPAAVECTRQPGFRRLIEQARQVFSMILIDMPAINRHFDALSLAGVLDGLVLVAQAERTRLADIESARARLGQKGIRLLGIVLNRHHNR